MFIENCRFKRDKDSEWEKGLYIGETDNCEKSVILDKDYSPVKDVYDYAHGDMVINIPFKVGA